MKTIIKLFLIPFIIISCSSDDSNNKIFGNFNFKVNQGKDEFYTINGTLSNLIENQ